MKRLLTVAAVVLLALSAFAATPIAASGFITTSDGVRLHYVSQGKGPAIVFIPGWTMPGSVWQQQVAYFSARYRVITIDPRSQGESDKTDKGLTPERRARDYKEVIDHLQLKNVVLVGWSMAAPELVSYVDQFGAANVRGLVLVDGFFDAAGETTPAQQKAMESWFREMETNRGGETDKFVRSMFHKPQTEQYLKALIADALKTPTPIAVALVQNYYSRDWRPVLRKLNLPVLYVCTPANRKQAETLASQMPHARVELFEGAGHALFVDDAERFNKLLDSFVRSLPTKSTPNRETKNNGSKQIKTDQK